MMELCDICGATMQTTSGYSYTTTRVANSPGYWRKLFERDLATYGGDGSMVASVVMMMIVHGTPWIVCESCSRLVDADAKAAHRYAASYQAPPGCGPADQQQAAMTAAYVWSLMYNEWPASVQVGQNLITHDPAKGTRCDFCRRIMYGDEKFSMFGEKMYKGLVANGARFARTPMPECVVKGEPYWIACMTCFERSGANAAGQASSATSTAGGGHEKRPWWRFW